MTNTKLFLLIGTSLYLIPNLASAQCVATQDCATLGYTETSCSGGSGVKCPFGNKWACFKSESALCTDLGFTLSCTGTGYSSGAGKTCNGKYNYCICSNAFTWNALSQSCEPNYSGCTVGALFYSDNTCSDKLESSKTLLGVVIYEKSARQNGWIMTVSPIQIDIAWSTESVDIPGLTNYTSNVNDIQASCTNTDVITTYGSSSKYPAAWAAKNYKPTGTPSGKSWCLPSGGLLKNALANSTNFAKINAAISTVGGKKVGFGTPDYSSEFVWSSSEYAYNSAWAFGAKRNINDTFGLYRYGKSANILVSIRPVMEF